MQYFNKLKAPNLWSTFSILKVFNTLWVIYEFRIKIKKNILNLIVWKEINYKEDSNDLLIPNITYKINPAEIESIEANSIAQQIGFESGDSIISINGKKPRDLIDYQILISEEVLDISVLDKHHEIHNVSIEKDQDANLGINFKDALFDSIKQCNNKCPFCFIDQQPSGKRKSLYIKDDDYRLSFLYGSYLTLTNLKKEDWERIATQ